jgi:hypothetical protein
MLVVTQPEVIRYVRQPSKQPVSHQSAHKCLPSQRKSAVQSVSQPVYQVRQPSTCLCCPSCLDPRLRNACTTRYRDKAKMQRCNDATRRGTSFVVDLMSSTEVHTDDWVDLGNEPHACLPCLSSRQRSLGPCRWIRLAGPQPPCHPRSCACLSMCPAVLCGQVSSSPPQPLPWPFPPTATQAKHHSTSLIHTAVRILVAHT